MNEWDRRNLEVLQNHKDLMEVALSLSEKPIIEYFGYTAKIGSPAGTAIALNTPQQATIIVQSDAYFVLEYISTTVIKLSNPHACRDSGNITLQITDTGSGGILYNQAFVASLVTGSPGQSAQIALETFGNSVSGVPFIFPIPRIIAPHTNIKLEVNKFLDEVPGTETFLIYVALMGARVTQG